MAIPRNINTLEVEKFKECPDEPDKPAVRIINCGGPIITTPSGLTVAGRVTIVSITSVGWTVLPATALTDRNAITIQNTGGTEIKLNYDISGSPPVIGYVGVIMPVDGERFYDITDDIKIYARAASGSPSITVEELA